MSLKINEAETLSGVSRKNIRFYEEQGLLRPHRNAENGYREYSDDEVQILLRIRLMRKLGVPIEEIRKMLDGVHTVGDGMRRHLISLERDKQNLEQSIHLCEQLQNMDQLIGTLDAKAMLDQMTQLESKGICFPERQEERARFAAPIAIAASVAVAMLALCGLLIWAILAAPKGASFVWILVFFMLLFCAIAIGVMLAMMQQIREIRKGELDDAKRY